MKNIVLAIIPFLLLAFNRINAQDTLVLHSEFLPANDTVLVFTPKDYNPKDSIYPVIYMLHGYGGNYSQMNKLLHLQDYANEYNFIIVCPDGLFDSWYIDSPVRRKSQWETFFFTDLYPGIKKDYATDTSNIFITGLSMGGHGAMYLFLRHSKKFKAAASSSGVLDLNYSALKYSSLSNMLGEYNSSISVFNEYSTINQLDSIKFTDKAIFVDCGNKDHLLEANNKFNEACMDRWIQITYMNMQGRHNAQYWKTSFPWHFEFFEKQIEK